jgi:hypothetical protein
VVLWKNGEVCEAGGRGWGQAVGRHRLGVLPNAAVAVHGLSPAAVHGRSRRFFHTSTGRCWDPAPGERI